MATHQLAPVLQHIRAIADPTPDGDLADGSLLTRFARRGDEAAFAELVRRHGSLVLGVYRRILGDVHAAEDAFQATFLLLARKADRLRRPDRLGPWLYGVARRVALKARMVTNRRREVRAVDVASSDPDDCSDLRPVLDEAIARLPARDRTPVVLCYFQGLTYAEAARRLRCPPGTVSARLARARTRLRVLLTRRGIVPAAGAIASALTSDSVAATVPTALRNAAVHYALGASIIPAGVVTLTKGIGHAMIVDKIKMMAVVAMLGTAGTGAWVYGPAAAQPPITSPAAQPQQPVVREDPKPAAEVARFETANFVVTAPTVELARRFGEAAERERKAQAVLWLGAEMSPWPKRCPLAVRVTMGGAGGATKLNYDLRGNYEILSMDLEGPLEKMLETCLPHEITHTVLAHYFRLPIPQWADEGAAVLAETPKERERHDRLARDYLDQHKRMPVGRMFELKDYGGFADTLTLYAEGFSVTRFLIDRKDRATFLRFVETGMAGRWDVAAKACYGFDGVEALEAAWMVDLKAARPEQTKTSTDAPSALNSQAKQALQAKEYERAIALWHELQHSYPDSSDAFYANLQLGLAYWGIARKADEQLRVADSHDRTELSASRRDALNKARDSFQIIEQSMLAWQIVGRLVAAGDDEKLKQASFWGADCDFWLARYEMAESHYSALAIRYEGKPEEMIAIAQIRQCCEALHQPERAIAVARLMKERVGSVKFEIGNSALATHKRDFWEKLLAELEKPMRREMGPPPG